MLSCWNWRTRADSCSLQKTSWTHPGSFWHLTTFCDNSVLLLLRQRPGPEMSDSRADFGQLMERVRDGMPNALDEVCERYSHYIRRVVRRRMHQRLRAQYDSD